MRGYYSNIVFSHCVYPIRLHIVQGYRLPSKHIIFVRPQKMVWEGFAMFAASRTLTNLDFVRLFTQALSDQTHPIPTNVKLITILYQTQRCGWRAYPNLVPWLERCPGNPPEFTFC